MSLHMLLISVTILRLPSQVLLLKAKVSASFIRAILNPPLEGSHKMTPQFDTGANELSSL